MQFSVLMSVYKNETVDNFCCAMDSVLSQSLIPDEIVLIRDGEVPEYLQGTIDRYVRENGNITYIPLEKNGGLGNALRVGLAHAKYGIIARMDTDDICAEGRFETQIRFLKENPDVDIVGGQVEEFIGEESNIVAKRSVPLTDGEIKKFLKGRCPFNHPTVMFRKEAVEKVGGYEDFYLLEDYYLWCKMAVAGLVLANVEKTLVYMRMSEDSYRRRGGKKYYQSLKALECYKRKNGLIGFWKYRKNLFVRFMQCYLPNGIRERIYKKMRKDKNAR